MNLGDRSVDWRKPFWRRHRGALLLGLAGIYLFATTYPFDWMTNDAVLEGDTAVFREQGILLWDRPVRWDHESLDRHGLSVSMKVRDYRVRQFGPARILTISRDHHHSNLTIGQEDSDLVVRLRRASHATLGLPPYVVEDVFLDGEPHRIAVRVTRKSVSVLVDGEERIGEELRQSPFQFWQSDYVLALGNERTWQRPWLGTIEAPRIVMSSTETDLLESEEMVIAGFWDLLVDRFEIGTSSGRDAALNFLAMVPFGFFSARLLSRSGVSRTLPMWLFVCAGAETIQVMLYSRHPCLTDFLLNCAGVSVGALIARRRHDDGLDDMPH